MFSHFSHMNAGARPSVVQGMKPCQLFIAHNNIPSALHRSFSWNENMEGKILVKTGACWNEDKTVALFFWQNDSLFSSSMSGSHNTQHTQSDLCKCMEVEMYNGERRKRRSWGRTAACAVKVGAGEPELNQMKSGTDASLLQDGDAAAPNSTQNLGLSSCWKFYSRFRFKGSVNKRNHSLHTNNSNFS